ncbi:clostripain-related cysteine peptidase [Tenacibaculum xiamenense]|uniref:clostripain-related cysteine peptidase n=1 Tax=Tenacibaculum xiamenense TaxID=1261553 RepID=UPI0038935ACE
MTNLFLFIAGDNNLDLESEEELNGVLRSEVGSGYRIFIEIDRYKTYISKEKARRKTKRYIVDSKGVKVFFVEEKNTGDYRALKSFIEWGGGSCSGNNNYLILWGHGYGWEGCAHDYSQNDVLELDELKKALKIGRKKGFKLIGFDMCQMATIEVFYVVRNYADLIIASQNVEPPEGWEYDNLFKKQRDVLDFSKQILCGYSHQCELKGGEDFTLSMSNTVQINKFVKMFDDWCFMILKDARLLNMFMELRRKCVDFKYNNYVDLKCFLQIISKEGDDLFKSKSDKLFLLLDEIIIKTVNGNIYKHATGISIYFPLKKIPQATLERYCKTEFTMKVKNWGSLVFEYQNRLNG